MENKNGFSNNLRKFVSEDFLNSYDYNITQIIQKFVMETKALFIRMMDDTRENIVNSSNFTNLLDFASKSFSEKQKIYGLNYGNTFIKPIEYSTNNIVIDVKAIIPGNDEIRHFYKVDGNIKAQKKIGDPLYSVLKSYSANEYEEDKKMLKDKLVSCHNQIMEDDNTIIPMSYCIPMDEKYAPNDPSPIYKDGIINIYTHLDKDDLYKVFMSVLFNKFSMMDSYDLIDTTNHKTVFHSFLGLFIKELEKSDVISYILNHPCVQIRSKEVIFRSALGSLSKYYDNMGTNGVCGFIINEFKRIIKTTKTSETWDTRDISYKNPVDVMFGSRGMDHIFNFTIAEILQKKLYDKIENSDDAIFEYLISNSFSYIIASGSLSIGDGDIEKGLENLIDTSTELLSCKNKYIDDIAKEYYRKNEEIVASVITIMYGTFMVKHLYDLRKRLINTSHFSVKEYTYFKGVLAAGIEMVETNIDNIRNAIKDFVDHNRDNPGLVYCDDKGNIDDIINPNGIFDYLKNVTCRIMTMPTIYRLSKNIYAITNKLEQIANATRKNPVFGGDSHTFESDDKWVYNIIFHKSTENLINKFVGDCKIGGNVQKFCDNLVVDTHIATEAEDEELLSDCIRRSIILNDLRYKNASESDTTYATRTLEKVSNLILQ